MQWYEQIIEQFSSPWAKFLAAAGVGLILGLIAATILKVIEVRSTRPLIKNSAARTRSFAFVIGIVIGLKFGINAFDLGPATLAQVQSGFTFAIFLLATWGLNHIYDSIHETMLTPWGQRKDNANLVQVGGTVARLLIWLLGIITGLNNAGYNVTSVLAGLGIGGLAFALAAQDTVANIFGGVVVLTQSPFRVGDRIEVNGTDGWVNTIGMRSTVIDTWLGHRVTLPNKMFTESAVVNIDARSKYWEELRLKLRHDCTTAQIERAMELVTGIIAADDRIYDSSWVGVGKIGEGFIEIEVWYGTLRFESSDKSEEFPNEYAKVLGVKSEFHMSLLRGLEEAKIPLATQIQGIILHKEAEMGQSGSRF